MDNMRFTETGQLIQPVENAPGRYVGKQQITSLSTVKSLTVPDNARSAQLVPEGQAIRIHLDGGTPGTPTTADMLLAVGQPMEVVGRTELANVRMLEEAASAKVNVWYLD